MAGHTNWGFVKAILHYVLLTFRVRRILRGPPQERPGQIKSEIKFGISNALNSIFFYISLNWSLQDFKLGSVYEALALYPPDATLKVTGKKIEKK